MKRTERDRPSLIESAITPPIRQATDDGASAATTSKNGVGRQQYDQALAHRLEQLKSAMGENSQPAPSVEAGPSIPSATAGTRTFRFGTLLGTALASALLGAGLTWLALGSSGSASSLPPSPSTVRSPPPASPILAAENVAATLPPASRIDQDKVGERLEAWRQAWAKRDIETYLSFYSPDFVPSKGQKRAEWAADRRKNLSKRGPISISLHDLRTERIAEDRIRLSFRQDYASGNYREAAQAKTLLMVRQGPDWLILGEWQGENQDWKVGR